MTTATTKAAKNGQARQYLSPDEMEANAPADITEEDVEAFGGWVRVRALSAHAAARVQAAAVKPVRGGQSFQMVIPDAEVLKFSLGVIEPEGLERDPNRVMRLYQKSGVSFKRVLAVIDRISGMDENALEAATAAFPGSGEDGTD